MGVTGATGIQDRRALPAPPDRLRSSCRFRSPRARTAPTAGDEIQSGVDNDHDGLLSDAERTSTTFVCNGQAGQTGTPGTLLTVTMEAPGAHCSAGGLRIDIGLDGEELNGALDPAEVTKTSYVCNGTTGGGGSTGSPDAGASPDGGPDATTAPPTPCGAGFCAPGMVCDATTNACVCPDPDPAARVVSSILGDDDSGNGSAVCPFKTITHALGSVATLPTTPKITIQVRGAPSGGTALYTAGTGETFPLTPGRPIVGEDASRADHRRRPVRNGNHLHGKGRHVVGRDLAGIVDATRSSSMETRRTSCSWAPTIRRAPGTRGH